MMQMSEAFDAVALLVIAVGAAPLSKHQGCWEYRIDDHWQIAVNGHKEPHIGLGVAVKPFAAYVEYNGWAAGIITPVGGIFAAGSKANEDTFIAAVQAATERAKSAGTPVKGK